MRKLKKYVEPEMVVEIFSLSDVIVTSGETPNTGNGNGEEVLDPTNTTGLNDD